MAAGDINLLKSRSSLSPQLLAIQEQVRWVGLGSLALVILVAVGLGATYMIFLQQRQALETRRKQVLSAIANESVKEGLYFSIRQRLPVVEKAFGVQKPWGTILDDVYTIARPPDLASVVVDDQNVVVLSVKTTSVEQTAVVVNAVVRLVQEKRIKSPQLLGLQLTKDGTVQVNLSYIPTL